MPKLTLLPSGQVLEVNSQEPLLTQLKKSGLAIKSSCGGCATCGDCVLIVKSGELNMAPQTFEELRLLGNVFHITRERLACQTKITGDVVVDISAHADEEFEIIPAKKVAVKVRKKEDIERDAPLEQATPANQKGDWYKHWDNKSEDGERKPKKLGGNKRPKAFSFNDKEDKKSNPEDKGE